MREFVTQSGTTATVDFCGFKTASKLKRTIEKELLKVNIDSGIIDKKAVKNILEANITAELINSAKNVYLTIDASEEVEKALFECFIRCTYNGEKITYETFDKVEAVSDYMELALNCIAENLSPFFKSQVSMLSNLPIFKKSNVQKPE